MPVWQHGRVSSRSQLPRLTLTVSELSLCTCTAVTNFFNCNLANDTATHDSPPPTSCTQNNKVLRIRLKIKTGIHCYFKVSKVRCRCCFSGCIVKPLANSYKCYQLTLCFPCNSCSPSSYPQSQSAVLCSMLHNSIFFVCRNSYPLFISRIKNRVLH